jgi:hypothetical protein
MLRGMRAVSAALAVATLTGCTYTVTHADGGRRLVGLMLVDIQPAPDAGTFAGQVVDVTTIGVALNRNPAGSTVALGFNRETTGFLRDNAMVLGDPTAVRRTVEDRP